jgi:hypothetical protein
MLSKPIRIGIIASCLGNSGILIAANILLAIAHQKIPIYFLVFTVNIVGLCFLIIHLVNFIRDVEQSQSKNATITIPPGMNVEITVIGGGGWGGTGVAMNGRDGQGIGGGKGGKATVMGGGIALGGRGGDGHCGGHSGGYPAMHGAGSPEIRPGTVIIKTLNPIDTDKLK